MGLPVRIVSVSELKESTFVILLANFFLMFYCPFPKKRCICSANTETLQEPKSEVTENKTHKKVSNRKFLIFKYLYYYRLSVYAVHQKQECSQRYAGKL